MYQTFLAYQGSQKVRGFNFFSSTHFIDSQSPQSSHVMGNFKMLLFITHITFFFFVRFLHFINYCIDF